MSRPPRKSKTQKPKMLHVGSDVDTAPIPADDWETIARAEGWMPAPVSWAHAARQAGWLSPDDLLKLHTALHPLLLGMHLRAHCTGATRRLKERQGSFGTCTYDSCATAREILASLEPKP